MTTKKQQQSVNDFDIDAVITTTTEHQKILEDVQKRVSTIEEDLKNADLLGKKMSKAIDNSTPLRKSLGNLLIELLSDHDAKDGLSALIKKIDRERLVQLAKYGGAFLVGAATVLATIFGYTAIT